MEQLLLTAAIVTACALYAAWALMPAAARRWLVRSVLAVPLPDSLASALSPYATAPTGCACDGCDRSATGKAAAKVSQRPGTASASAAPTIAPIVFHPRRKS